MIKAKSGNMRKSRIIAGLSQTETAKRISLNTASVCLIENGKLGAKPKTAKALCELFKKPFDELFEITENQVKEE